MRQKKSEKCELIWQRGKFAPSTSVCVYDWSEYFVDEDRIFMLCGNIKKKLQKIRLGASKNGVTNQNVTQLTRHIRHITLVVNVTKQFLTYCFTPEIVRICWKFGENVLYFLYYGQIPKVQKDTDDLTEFFALLGSLRVKAACKIDPWTNTARLAWDPSPLPTPVWTHKRGFIFLTNLKWIYQNDHNQLWPIRFTRS